MPKQVVPDIIAPEPPLVVHELVVEANANIEPEVVALVVIPEVNNEDIEEDEESEIDPEETKHMNEDIDAIVPGPVPIADIAQIAGI